MSSKKDRFFMGDGNTKRTLKRPAAAASASSNAAPKGTKRARVAAIASRDATKGRKHDDNVSSDEGEDRDAGFDIDRTVYSAGSGDDDEDDEDRRESAAEKRLRLAKAYLDQVKGNAARTAEFEGGFDAADLDRDIVAERLRDDALESRGRLWRSLADQYLVTPAATAKFPRGHQLALTAVAVSPNRKFVFTGAKDGTIIMWNAMTMKKVKAILGLIKAAPAALAAKGHTREVLCLAASASYLVSGGNDHKLNVWSLAPPPSLASATPAAPAPPELNHIKQFASHRDAVTGAVFRRGTQHLYTSSRDRTIKTWDLDEMTYVETLFGHQDPIPALDAAPSGKEMCFTAGGRDKSMRAWKIVDESQLVFRASSSHGSLDVVYAVTDDLFVSGDDHGNLSLWHTGKKKAIHSVAGAHGYMPRTESDLELGLPRRPYWVTAIAGIKFSDLLFSGSWSGDIICWRVDRVANKLHRASAIPVPGCINSLTVAEPADYPPALIASGKNDAATAPSTSPEHSLVLYAATGQEHKNGRWWKVPEARNVLYKVELSPLVNVSSSR